MRFAAKPGATKEEATRGLVPRVGAMDLEAHLRDPTRKQAFVTPMFDVIAPRYDAFTRLFSFGMDVHWKRAAITAAVTPELVADRSIGDVLDLASGTGDFAVGIARRLPAARVWALDASTGMVEMARRRLATGDADVAPRVHVMVGVMTALPYPDASMDLVTSGYGLRNVPDAERAIREMRRVLRCGGQLILLDFFRPAPALWRSLFLGYLHIAGNAVGWWWHRDPVVYGYIARSIDHFISWQQCRALLTRNGFHVVHVTRRLGGGVAQHNAVAI